MGWEWWLAIGSRGCYGSIECKRARSRSKSASRIRGWGLRWRGNISRTFWSRCRRRFSASGKISRAQRWRTTGRANLPRPMPELPEVQILVNQLGPRLEGARIRAVEVRDPKLRLAQSVVGRTIRRVWRRGKYILFDLTGALHLALHLRMNGWFEF